MKLKFRFATPEDIYLYYNWANDPLVRQNSYTQDLIPFETHQKWFNSKIHSDNNFFYLFLNEEDTPVGQVRIEKGKEETIIGVSVDQNFRGLSLSSIMLKTACIDFKKNYPEEKIIAYIKESNLASLNAFRKAGFVDLGKKKIGEGISFQLIYKHDAKGY